ncbi:MAG: DegV family protein [Oscillospiraceae bacterium]
MKIKLVVDCSANICQHITQDISYVPLKIVTKEKEYIDTPELDVAGMLQELKAYKGSSGTACPSIQDWLDAFDDADIVYGVSLTSSLSGCYNSAMIAVQEYLERKPDAKVFIMDSLSTGPELELLLEKYQELIAAGLAFEEVCEGIRQYSERTHLVFSLESLDNFAKNGRVSPVIAKAVGILGLRIVGKASESGTLEPMHKCRGEKKAVQQLLNTMKELGYQGGKVRISHTFNPDGAQAVAGLIREEFPDCDLSITPNRGLCCFYAEEGSILVGFEDR